MLNNNDFWLIADTHFCHKNIINYCDRPFENVNEMSEMLIKNWNQVISKNDKVYMLGDFALCGKDKIIEIGNQLNGRKTLILGNHDGASLKTYYDAGFEMVIDHPIIVDDFYILSHEPQFVQPNGLYANIFGHVHNNPEYTTISERSACVSVERWDYKPVKFSQIVRLISNANLVD